MTSNVFACAKGDTMKEIMFERRNDGRFIVVRLLNLQDARGLLHSPNFDSKGIRYFLKDGDISQMKVTNVLETEFLSKFNIDEGEFLYIFERLSTESPKPIDLREWK